MDDAHDDTQRDREPLPVQPAALTRAAGARAVGRAVLRAALRPGTYPGFFREALSAGMTLVLYPAGVVSEALKVDSAVGLGDGFTPGLPLRYLDIETASTPVILVHGALHNRSGFLLMKRTLKRRGFRHVHTWNYTILGRDVPALARTLAERVFDVLFDTGATHVQLVGHSLGGLICRYYVQELDGWRKVRTLVTLGTPHQGTHAAVVGPARAARQLRPGSDLIEQLAQSARPLPTRFVSVYSNFDSMILPAANARIAEEVLAPQNLLVPHLGHVSLLSSRAVIRSVVALLSVPAPGVERSRPETASDEPPAGRTRRAEG